MATNTGLKVVGTRPIRHDGVEKVTGQAKYGADYQSTGVLHAKVLRSPHAHAVIKSINTEKAASYPGVRAVVTSKDLPEPPDQPVSLGEGPMVNMKQTVVVQQQEVKPLLRVMLFNLL